jgi:hypothetical protein
MVEDDAGKVDVRSPEVSHTAPDSLPGKAQVINTAETREEAWAKHLSDDS